MSDEEQTALLKKILANQDRQHRENVQRGEHVVETTDSMAAMISDLSKDAFPGGDAGGHRRYHESVIKTMEARQAFWNDMRSTLARYGLVGVAGFIAVALWTYFQSRVLTK